MTDDPERARLAALLDAIGVEYELFPCDPALADTAQFCAAYGFALDDSANTIVVAGKANPRRYAACIALATTRLDVNRSVRDRLGTRKASFAGGEETRDLTGMEIGGVTPFGLPADLPILIDAAVMQRERIVLGGGSRSWKVIAAPRILTALGNATVVDGLATAAGATTEPGSTAEAGATTEPRSTAEAGATTEPGSTAEAGASEEAGSAAAPRGES